MKRYKTIILLLIMPLLWSCSSVHLLQLDTIRPAQVDYHINMPQMVVVNNSEVPNSSEYSRYIDENGKRYRLSYDGDSIPNYFAMELAQQLHDSQYFESVEVLLTDSSYITGSQGVDSLLYNEWMSQYPYSVHLSINDIRPCATMQVEPLDGYFAIDLCITSTSQLQCFIPGDTVRSIIVADTVSWLAYGETPQWARSELPAFEECIYEAIVSLASRTSQYLVPHNHTVERYIFVTGHSAMRDAYRYWEREQYTEASYLWEYVYEKGKNRGRRAKAAVNLALFHELNDNYEKAHEYARNALTLFIDNGDVAETEYTTYYCNELKRRMEENALLNRQSW